MNEHIPEYILSFIKEKMNNKTKAVINATKRFSIAEHPIITSIVQTTMIYRDLRLLTIERISLIWL